MSDAARLTLPGFWNLRLAGAVDVASMSEEHEVGYKGFGLYAPRAGKSRERKYNLFFSIGFYFI